VLDHAHQSQRPLDLAEALRTAVRLHGNLLRAARVRVELHADHSVPAVINSGGFSQLVAQLLHHACEHAFVRPPPRRLKLRLYGEPEQACLQVAHDGAHFTPALLTCLQGDWNEAAQLPQAQGLSLHLIGQLCQLLHGQIEPVLSPTADAPKAPAPTSPADAPEAPTAPAPDPASCSAFIIRLPVHPPESH